MHPLIVRIFLWEGVGTYAPTFGVDNMPPKAEKVSYNNFSSTSGSRLPIKRLAPISRFFLSWDALFTRIGLLNNFT